MAVSLAGEYAIRALVFLARCGGGPRTTRQIAAGAGLPPGYLSKLLNGLARAGLITGQRGSGGGFALAIPGRPISLAEVVAAVDGDARSGGRQRGEAERCCPLHRRLIEGEAGVTRVLEETTVGDLAAEESREGRCPRCHGE